MRRLVPRDWGRGQACRRERLATGDISVMRNGYVRAVEAKGHHFVRGLFTFKE